MMHAGAWLDLVVPHLAYVHAHRSTSRTSPSPSEIAGSSLRRGNRHAGRVQEELRSIRSSRTSSCWSGGDLGLRGAASGGVRRPGRPGRNGVLGRGTLASARHQRGPGGAAQDRDARRHCSERGRLVDTLLQGTTDAIFATDDQGVVVAGFKPAFDRLRLHRDLPARIVFCRPGEPTTRFGRSRRRVRSTCRPAPRAASPG